MRNAGEAEGNNATSAPFDAIIFDVGGVLVAHDNAVMYERLGSRCATPYSPARVHALMRQTKWSTGALPMSVFHEQLRTEAGYAAAWDQFVADLCCHFTVDAAMLAFVQRLTRGNRVILFSNTIKEHWDYLAAATGGALDRFERYLSHEIGYAKPSVEAFLHVAGLAGIEPARCVFFDDLPENVDGARQAGFQADLFEGQRQLSDFLTAQGVRWPAR